MIRSITPEELGIAFPNYCITKIKQLSKTLEHLRNELANIPSLSEEEIMNRNLQLGLNIQFGARVLMQFDDRRIKKGCVWAKKNYNDLYEVNKDGLMNYKIFPSNA
jgi:hypothetical protein